MAIVEIGQQTTLLKKEYIGLSTDVKSTTSAAGSKFFETDTKNIYIYTGVAWTLYHGSIFAAAGTNFDVDQGTTFPASTAVGTVKKFDFTTPPSGHDGSILVEASNNSITSALNYEFYAIEPNWINSNGVSESRAVDLRSAFWLEACPNLLVEDCEDAWADGTGANVTVTTEGTIKKVGTNSNKIALAAGVTANQLLTTETITAVNLSSYTHMQFWFYSDVALAAGDMQLLLDDTANCASPLETLSIPAMDAATWTYCSIILSDPTLLTAVTSIGLKQVVDKGACNLYIDDVRAVKMVTKAYRVSNAFLGTGVTFRATVTNVTADTVYPVYTKIRVRT